MNPLRIVPDTNIIIAVQRSTPKSPNQEIFDRWENGECELLYSDDTIYEYFLKLKAFNVPQADIDQLLLTIVELAEHVIIEHYHLASHQYPQDPDDIAFILCAENGKATHLVTYDSDLLKVQDYHTFKICRPFEFLEELRQIEKH